MAARRRCRAETRCDALLLGGSATEDGALDVIMRDNGSTLGIDRAEILGPALGAVRHGTRAGTGPIACSGLPAQAANQACERGNRTREVRRRLIGVQIRPIHHEGSGGERTNGERVVGAGDLNVKQAGDRWKYRRRAPSRS